MKNPFEELGINLASPLLAGLSPRDCSAVAKAMYRALSIILHPDKFANATDAYRKKMTSKMEKMNLAMEALESGGDAVEG